MTLIKQRTHLLKPTEKIASKKSGDTYGPDDASDDWIFSMGPQNPLRRKDDTSLWSARAIVVLLFLTLLPSCLLFQAYRENQEATATATDINQSGSLRYRSIWVYAASHHADPTLDFHTEWKNMAAIRVDLARKYPAEIKITDVAWQAFDTSLRERGTVEWDVADAHRHAANELTQSLNDALQKRHDTSSHLLWGGITSLLFTLLWGLRQIVSLRNAQDETLHKSGLLSELTGRYAALFDNTPAALFSYTPEGKILEWNRACEVMYGWTTVQAVGKNLKELGWGRQNADTIRHLIGAAQTDGVHVLDSEFSFAHTVTKETRRALYNAFPLCNRKGEIVGAISAAMDVTVRRKTEEERTQLLSELQIATTRLRNVTAQARVLFWQSNIMEVPMAGSGRILAPYNKERKTFLRWDTQVLDEADALRCFPITREGDGSFARAWRDARSLDENRRLAIYTAGAFQAGVPSYSLEYALRLADGSERWVLEQIEVTRQFDGEWTAVGACIDITPQKEAENRLRHALEDLARSNRSLEDFAAAASHDLQEPVRKIRTFADLLARRTEGQLSDEAAGYVSRIRTSGERMQTLIEGILAFSRVSGKEIKQVPVDLNKTLAGIISDFETTISEASAVIEVPAPLPTLSADPTQMRQLLHNLVENALRYHRQNRAPHIRITSEIQSGANGHSALQITVSDNGVGFEPRYAERIFEMFERADGAVNGADGSGVGLAICRRIAERHGGTIRAEGHPGVGADFIVTFPYTTP